MTGYLVDAFIYLCAAVIAVPLAKRLGLGSVLGYLVAGVIVGPWGLGVIADVQQVLHVAEFGVVLLLFVGMSGMLWEGGQDVINGRMSGGELGAFVFYAIMVGSGFATVSEVWGELQRAAAGIFNQRDQLGVSPQHLKKHGVSTCYHGARSTMLIAPAPNRNSEG